MSDGGGRDRPSGAPRVLLLLGAGGHARVAGEAALAGGRYDRVRFRDDRPDLNLGWQGYRLEGSIREWLDAGAADADGADVFVAIGANDARAGLLGELRSRNRTAATLVHPRAYVAPTAAVAAGTIVCAGAVVGTDVEAGVGLIANTSAVVDHDCRLGDCVHVSPAAALGGAVRVGDRSWIGIGACVREGVSIGADVIVAAGATVVADVADGIVVAGTPATPLRRGGR